MPSYVESQENRSGTNGKSIGDVSEAEAKTGGYKAPPVRNPSQGGLLYTALSPMGGMASDILGAPAKGLQAGWEGIKDLGGKIGSGIGDLFSHKPSSEELGMPSSDRLGDPSTLQNTSSSLESDTLMPPKMMRDEQSNLPQLEEPKLGNSIGSGSRLYNSLGR